MTNASNISVTEFATSNGGRELPLCPVCGTRLQPTGSCYSCSNCGYGGGCGG